MEILARTAKTGDSKQSPWTKEERQKYLEDSAQRRADSYNSSLGDLVGFDCPLCKNRGYYAKAKGTEMVMCPCTCQETRKSLRIAKESGLGEQIKRYTFEAYQTPEAWQCKAKTIALSFASRPEGWFIASGAVGSGKSHLCTAICNELMAVHKRAVRYFVWRDQISAIKAASTDSSERDRLINPMKEADVLYIDDFLKVGRGEQPTVADVTVAFEIIAARYNSGACTIISTERSMDEILSLDEALGSRIYELGKEHYLRFEGQGKNWRLR